MLRRVVPILATLAIVSSLLLWQWFEEALSKSLVVGEVGLVLEVTPGTGINLLADKLVKQGVLESSLPLKIYARLYRLSDIKAGDYLLSGGETSISLLEKLTTGAVRQHFITFPEGWTLSQWRSELASASYLTHTLSEHSSAETAKNLGIEYENPEGWFAPDTYLYRSGDSDLSVLNRAYRAMTKQLNKLWPERQAGLPYQTPYEALVMASIIEKETGTAEERAQIAGVFVLRLQKNMLLQTDPSVIYGLGENFDGNLTRQHLKQESAYNTYRRKGLPPTPIANPGVDALQAALHPAAGKALFFVAKGDGSHYFSASLDEHNKAVRKYQINNRARVYRSAPNPQQNDNKRGE